MKATVTASIKDGLLAGGWYTRRLGHDALPGVLVLCYHGVRSPAWRTGERAFANLHLSAATFDGHCRVIADTCHPISLDHWRASRAMTRSLPDRPVLVTFDDGYRSLYDVARPALKRYAIPATLFACSEPIQRQRLFWFDALARASGEAAVAQHRPVLSGPAWHPSGHADVVADPADPLAPLTVDHLKALADAGVEIGAHTATHVPLAALAPDAQRLELAVCRDALMRWIGGPVRSLAYPWGTRDADYTDETVGIAASLGFDFAFTTRPSFARADESPLELSRFLMLSEVAPAELAHRIAYSWR
jgi:peptidoglycan/xylan/chitin deacetylase (PgdA/CDA1 family)